MSRKPLFLAVGSVLLSLCGGLAASAQEIPQEPAGKTEVTNLLVNPALIYLFKEQEAADPQNTVFKLREGSLTAVSTSGNMNRVAEFRPLENTVRLKDLYFLKNLGNGQLTLQADTEAIDDRRAIVKYTDPELGNIEVRDTRLVHRLEHDRRADVDTRPGDQYYMNWERTEVEGALALGDLPVRAVVRADNQSRAGAFQHSFFQIHRFNCTDCHTVSATKGMNQLTRSFDAGLVANPAERTVVGLRLGGSNFDDQGSRLIYSFNGPFGTSPVAGNSHSRDEAQSYTAAGGGEKWRLSGQFSNIDRRNEVTGNKLNGQFFSGQGVYQPNEYVQFLGGMSTDRQSRTLATNLSTDRTRSFLEVNVTPVPEAYASARFGQDENRYSQFGFPATNRSERYYELRGGWRPDKSVRLNARLRSDDISNPYFPTDPNSRTLLEAGASWSPLPVTVGIDYRSLQEKGELYATSEETTLGYLMATLDNGFGANLTYSVTDLDSNSSASFYLDDPTSRLLLLQQGYPYTATIKSLTAGVDVPFGQSGWRLRPTYRNTRSESQALLLPPFPTLTADSRLDLLEETIALRLDLPPWDDSRLGIGWEQQRWTDHRNSGNNGVFSLWMLNYSTRY